MIGKRLFWADAMKAGSILSVVLYHTNIMAEIKTTAYILCLPAFFFLSGVFSNTTYSIGDFFRKKTLRLLVPYVFFGVIGWLLWVVVGRKYGGDANTNQVWYFPLLGMLKGNVHDLVQNPPLWFLCCMMVLEWFYYGIRSIRSGILRCILYIGLGAVGCYGGIQGWPNGWSVLSAMIMLPVYALGGECSSWIQQESHTQTNTRLLIVLLASIAGITAAFFLNPGINISTAQVGNPICFYISVAAVIGFWWSISVLIERVAGEMHSIEFIGSNTLLILCLHILMFGGIKGGLLICRVPLSFYETNAGSLLLWFLSIILLVPVIIGVKRYLPPLVSGRSPFIP